jgi:hypothetical protein
VEVWGRLKYDLYAKLKPYFVISIVRMRSPFAAKKISSRLKVKPFIVISNEECYDEKNCEGGAEMSLTITLPEPLATRLQDYAATSQRSADEVAATLLAEALPPPIVLDLAAGATEDSLLRLVERIQATPPNPRNVFSEEELRAKRAGLRRYLEASVAAEDPNEQFDEQEWNRQWDAVEADMKARDLADQLANERWFAEEFK